MHSRSYMTSQKQVRKVSEIFTEHGLNRLLWITEGIDEFVDGLLEHHET